MNRKIVFVNDCMKECHVTDKEILKEKVIDVINRADDYVNSIEDADTGKIADQRQKIFVKFFVVEDKVIVDQVQELVYMC